MTCICIRSNMSVTRVHVRKRMKGTSDRPSLRVTGFPVNPFVGSLVDCRWTESLFACQTDAHLHSFVVEATSELHLTLDPLLD